MAKTFTFAATDDFWGGNNIGWKYDFVSGTLRTAPSSFGSSNVTSTSNFDPLTVTTLPSINTFDHELKGSIAVTRVGTSTFSGGLWRASYVETVDLAKTKISSVVPRFGSFGDDTVSINLGGLVAYSLIGGKTLGQMVANGDKILGSALNDTLATTNFWEIVRGGAGNDVISSRGGSDQIFGDAGNDTLNGGTGADQMTGGIGNDTFFVDSAGDQIFETAGQGSDTVYTYVGYALPAGRHIETFAIAPLAGTAAINLAGNEFAQRISGNNGINSIHGGGGNDLVFGNGGNDVLAGGAGNDYFVFNTALNARTNVDRIVDFNVTADTVRLDNAVMAGLGTVLGMLSAEKFWKSTAGVAHDANDRIIYDIDSGKLFYDANGNATGGAVHFATLAPKLLLTHADFQVI